jgi:CRP/FNR family transcriptional regulator, cyclic AMP receptor protein
VATIDILRNVADTVRFNAGSTVLEEGQPGELMYIVRQGTLDIRVGNRVVASAGPGEIVGEIALIDHQGRSAAVIARTDADLVPVDEKRFLFLVQQTPYFALQVMRVLAERLRQVNTLVASDAGLGAQRA